MGIVDAQLPPFLSCGSCAVSWYPLALSCLCEPRLPTTSSLTQATRTPLVHPPHSLTSTSHRLRLNISDSLTFASSTPERRSHYSSGLIHLDVVCHVLIKLVWILNATSHSASSSHDQTTLISTISEIVSSNNYTRMKVTVGPISMESMRRRFETNMLVESLYTCDPMVVVALFSEPRPTDLRRLRRPP
jgi:hypothetical protein